MSWVGDILRPVNDPFRDDCVFGILKTRMHPMCTFHVVVAVVR